MVNPTSTSQTSSPALAKTSIKVSKKSKIVKLHLSSKLLTRFAPENKLADNKASQTSSAGSPKEEAPLPPAPESTANEVKLESNATPIPGAPAPASVPDSNSPAPPANGSKKRGIPGPKPGVKRGAGAMADSLPKPRGKPGPKKKPRLPDGTIDHGNGVTTTTTFGGVAPIAAHKLGPKANQGAINAGLRALDRSGRPCRKWEKKSFQLKSFTGITWGVNTWRAPRSNLTRSESKSDTTNSSDAKPKFESSALPSEKSATALDVSMPDAANQFASSPMPVEAA